MVLFLNDIGTSEVVLILVFILIFFGSKSIPGLARTLGRTIRQVKDASNDLQSEIRKTSNELKGELNLKELIDDTARDIQKPLDQYAADIEDVIKRTPINSMPLQKAVEAAPPIAPVDTPEIPNAPEVPNLPEVPTVPTVKPKTPSSPKNGPTSDSE